jgi:hypothetical protein
VLVYNLPIMKIHTHSFHEPDAHQLQVIALLEQSVSFEREVWRVRGLFEIPPTSFHSVPDLTPEMQATYDEWFGKLPLLYPYPAALKGDADGLVEEDFLALMRHHSEKQSAHEQEISGLIRRFTIPLEMQDGLKSFITTDSFLIGSDAGLFALHIDQKDMFGLGYLGAKTLREPALKNYIKEVRGVHLTITAKIKDNEQPSRKQLHKWIDENWDEIKLLMDVVKLPDYKPRNDQFDLMKLIYETAQPLIKNGMTEYEAIETTSEQFVDQGIKKLDTRNLDTNGAGKVAYDKEMKRINDQLGATNVSNLYRRFKHKLNELEKSKTDTDL